MPNTQQESSASSRPWQASVQVRLTREDGSGLVEEITYGGDGQFTKRFLATPGHMAPRLVQILDAEQVKALLAQLRTELQAPPAGVDIVALTIVVDLAEAAIKREEGS